MNARVWRVARTEVLEHRRQPWMLFILAANYLLWNVVFGAGFTLLSWATHDPGQLAHLQRLCRDAGIELDASVRLAVSTFGSLSFTNLPLFVAIFSGTSVLHDRETGALPFLMLAPLTRRQLLLGKLLGALALPLAFHLVLVGVPSLVFARLPVLAPHAHRLGHSPAWWVAFLVGAPASALLVGALGTVISARSRDLRTSMQFTSFFIGLLSLGIGAVLIDGLQHGVWFQLGFAAGCVGAAAVVLGAGARLISRDLTA